MLGHGPVCSCPFCSCASRVTTLFEAGGAHPGFFNFACVKLRCLEAELRDELQRLGQGGPTVGAAAPPAGPIRGEGTVTSQPKEEEKTKEPELNLTAKTAPPQPPARKSHPRPSEGETCLGKPKSEELPTKDRSVEPASGSKRPKEKKRSRTRGERASPRSRSRDRKRRESKRSQRSDSRRRRHRSPRDRSSGGKERKSRPERPPEPQFPPRHVGPILAWGPREPRYPPPVRQGWGWRGEVPYSSHPRWTESANKGQVKRAKQELHGRRRRR
jgi:hypothetical protein